jgi:hypothetical protein
MQIEISDEMREMATVAFDAAMNNPKTIPCKKCGGSGCHGGFGEDGHDQDWCSVCGGGGVELADGEENRPMKDALEAVAPFIAEQALERAAQVADQEAQSREAEVRGYESGCADRTAALAELGAFKKMASSIRNLIPKEGGE